MANLTFNVFTGEIFEKESFYSGLKKEHLNVITSWDYPLYDINNKYFGMMDSNRYRPLERIYSKYSHLKLNR